MVNRIKLLRTEKGMKQAELAKYLKVAQSTVSGWETGNYEVDFENLSKMADLFECSIDYLLGKTDIRNAYIPDGYAQKHKITKRDLAQYEDFIQHAGAFFMNDEVADEDKEKLFRDISELFWKAKEINKEKYGKKKKTRNE